MVSFEPGWDGRLGAMMRYASSASTCRRSIIARRVHCSPWRLHWRLHRYAAMSVIVDSGMTLLAVYCGGASWTRNGLCIEDHHILTMALMISAPADRVTRGKDASTPTQRLTTASPASRHFGEAPSACNSMCDVCSAASNAHAVERRDISAAALAVVRTLAEWPSAEKRATLIQLIDKWRASKMPADAKAGKAMSREDNERVIGQLLYSGYLQFDFSYTAYATNAYLKASQRASSILQGKIN